MPTTASPATPLPSALHVATEAWLDSRVEEMMLDHGTQAELLDELMEFDDGPKRATCAALRAVMLNPVGTPGHESAADSLTQLLHAQAYARARGELNRLQH